MVGWLGYAIGVQVVMGRRRWRDKVSRWRLAIGVVVRPTSKFMRKKMSMLGGVKFNGQL